MAVTIASTDAAVLMRIFQGRIADVVYYHDSFFGIPGLSIEPVTGGDSLRVPYNVLGNTSFETFIEGQDPPVEGQNTTVDGTQAWTYFRSMYKIERRVNDAAVGTELGPRIVQKGAADTMRALMAGVQVSFLAATATGLIGLVDASLALLGLNRATYTALQSYVQSPAGVLTMAHMTNIQSNIRDNPRVGRTTLIMSRINQKQRYRAFAPQEASGGTTPVNVNRADLGGDRNLDLGWSDDGTRFAGIPWLEMPDMANTVILALDMRDGAFRYYPHRAPEVIELAPTGDWRVFQYSTAAALGCERPRQQAKIDTLTA